MKTLDVAVDLGGTRLRVALVDPSRADLSLPEKARPELIARREERTILDPGVDATIEQIVRMIRAALSQEQAQVGAIGVASPGPLDSETGVVLAAPNMRGWHMVPLKAQLERLTGAQAHILNDAEASALAEYYFGSCNGRGSLVYLTVSTGIGGGVVIDGRLVEGSWGAGTELGHITVDRHGRRCKCGGVGCIEALASGTAISERFGEAIDAGATTTLLERLNGHSATAEDIAQGAADGDTLASRVFDDAMEALGFGVVTAINVFDPDIVVLGGGVTRSGEQVFAPVREIVQRYAMYVPGRKVRVLPTELGEDVGLLGAAIVSQGNVPLRRLTATDG